MSTPRILARRLVAFTAILLVADAVLLVLEGGAVGRTVVGASLLLHGALGIGWHRRTRGGLRSPWRRAIWPTAAVIYGLLAVAVFVFGGLAVGSIAGAALNGAALVLALAGSIAERRRTGERLTFVLHVG